MSFVVVMAIELGNVELVVVIIAFIAFLYLAGKAAGILMRILWLAAISAAFPLIMNQFFGFSFLLDINTFLTFIGGGIGLYLVYVVIKIVYSALAITEKAGKAVLSPFRKNEMSSLKKKVKKLEEGKEEK